MTCIPSLTLQQLELLRLAKQRPGETIQVAYEFPVVGNCEPPSDHPAFIQELIDAHLIQIKGTALFKRRSEFQQQSWEVFCDDLDYPTQKDWELWRKGMIAQQEGSIYPLILPGIRFEEFSNVWIREFALQAIEPGKL